MKEYAFVGMTIFSWEGFQFPQHHANYRIGNLKCISGRTCKTSVIKKNYNEQFVYDGWNPFKIQSSVSTPTAVHQILWHDAGAFKV